jgi:tetratricopeptide (TPR) repeat protein
MRLEDIVRILRTCLLLLVPGTAWAEVDEIERLLQEGRTVEALRELDSRLLEEGEHLGLEELRVDMRIGMGFGAGEVTKMDLRVQQDPSDVDGWYLLGRALLDSERSLAAYEEALRLDPGHARAWMGKGSLQQSSDACSSAEDSYMQALSLDPRLMEARVGRIRCHVQSEELEEALSLALMAVEELPGETNGWLALAALDEDREIETLQSALLHSPLDGEILGFLLDAALRAENLALSLETSQALVEEGDRQVVTTRGLLLELGSGEISWKVLTEILAARGQPLKPSRVVLLMKEWPDSSWLELIYARTLWASGEMDSAETLMRSLLADFEEGEAHHSLAMLLAAARRPADSARVLVPLAEIRPDDMEVQVLLAMALVDAGESGVAQAQLDLLLQDHPFDRGLRYTQAYVLLLIGDNPAAVTSCQAYLQFWPDEGVATWMVAAALASGLETEASGTLGKLFILTGNHAYQELDAQL